MLTVSFEMKNKLDLYQYHQRRDREGERYFHMKCQKTMTPATTAAVQNREEDPRRDPGSQNARDRSHRRRRIPAGDLFPPRTSHRIPRSASASASPLAFTLHHHHGSMPKPQLKTSAWAYPSIHAPRGGSPLPRLSLSPPWLSSSSPPPPSRRPLAFTQRGSKNSSSNSHLACVSVDFLFCRFLAPMGL